MSPGSAGSAPGTRFEERGWLPPCSLKPEKGVKTLPLNQQARVLSARSSCPVNSSPCAFANWGIQGQWEYFDQEALITFSERGRSPSLRWLLPPPACPPPGGSPRSKPEPFPYARLLSKGPPSQVAFPAFTRYRRPPTSKRNAIKLGQRGN